jgi:sterol desaturase/sphingolipid hydroxylase (fatty acid hydroxylase superfamily)
MHPHHLLHHWFYPAFLGAVLIEVTCYLVVSKRSYPWRDMFTSISIHVLHMPVRWVTPALVGPLAFFLWSHRLTTIPFNTAWGLMLLFLAEEFAYYWMHRCGHQIRWMWASHIVHHSPEHIHFASAVRTGVTEFLSGNWLFYLPLYLLGFNPFAVTAMLSINLFYQFWLHTDLVGRLGPLEWVFNTPSHHRVHHASNAEYLDRNYGGILIIWDRLFGTFAQEQPHAPITYGLVHPIGSRNPLKIAFHEWRAMARDAVRARSWRERLSQLFGRPRASLANLASGVTSTALPAEAVPTAAE